MDGPLAGLVSPIFRSGTVLFLVALLSVAAAVLAPASGARHDGDVVDRQEGRSLRDGVYTEAQAERGAGIWEESCAECHLGEEFGPAGGYLASWRGRTVNDLFEVIRTSMPYDAPGRLRRQEYADVLAYLFHLNGLPAGETEMKADAPSLKEIRVELPDKDHDQGPWR